MTFGDLPDPLDRYRCFKENTAYSQYEMNIPPLFLPDGNLVVPFDYKTAIPDGTLVAV